MPEPFVIVNPDANRPDPSRQTVWNAQRRPPSLSSHDDTARHYRPDAALVTAVNAAMTIGAPLLLTGEPGTGKTQLAHWVHWHLGLENRLFSLYVQSTTTARDLLYAFDNVAYFHAANDESRAGRIDKSDFLQKGPLWLAFDPPEPRAVVLVDEIDKAPRDFPNDLLRVLDQYKFDVPELACDGRPHVQELPKNVPTPLVIITSNSERKLPEPFLRRCIFHHIELTPELVERAVNARFANPELPADFRDAALARFWEIRGKPLRKKPATAELLVWLILLGAHRATAKALTQAALRELPALGALIKDRDDFNALE